MRTSKVIIKNNRIYVYTDWPSRLYFETPEMTKQEMAKLRDELDNQLMLL